MRVNLRKSLIAAFSFCLSVTLPAFAQVNTGTIVGRVTGAESGQPVPFAEVQLRAPGGREIKEITGQDGRFRLSEVPAGTYTITARAFTYSPQTVENVAITAGGTVTQDFALTSTAIVLDELNVSGSRGQPERNIDTPASVQTVNEKMIEARPAVSAVDHLRSIAAVDIITEGVQATNVVVRGFNNLFSGALYTLTDYRIAGVPSLRVNLMHFVPMTNEDIQHMEVVLGPGSALYGPNTANGVLHIISKSPLQDQGTTVSLTGGERSVGQGSFRTSHLLSERFGFKVSGQYLNADEWRFQDPVEISEQTKLLSDRAFWREDLSRAAGITPAEAEQWIDRVGQRDFDIEKFAGEARADWRVTEKLTTVFSVGSTLVKKGIEVTGLGAAVAKDWRYTYYQARANVGRGFAQLYLNTSDAGDTFLLRTGTPITDRSKLFVAQLQHGFNLGNRQEFTYGTDFLYTMPETEGTINGIYEDDDETKEYGAYLQSETKLSPRLDLVLAGRVDTHSALPDAIFSPRAGLVFKPAENQALRLTYNRAFSTPTSLNQFLDLGTAIPDPGAARLGYSVRVQGTGETGFRFRQSDGGYVMLSPFAPPQLGGPTQLLPAASAAAFWPAAVAVVAAQTTLPPALVGYLSSLQPTPAQIGSNFSIPGSGTSQPLADLDLADVEPIRESTNTTIEAGYKGIIGRRLLLAADVWYSKHKNLVTPLTTFTPFVTLNPQDIGAFLIPRLIMDLGMSQVEATDLVEQLAPGLARVPVGVISADEVHRTGAQLLASYTNLGDELDVAGVDLAATALLSDQWSLTGSISLTDEDVFETKRGQRVTLNAPRSKAATGLNYLNTGTGFNGELRARYTAEFPVQSGVYTGTRCITGEPATAEPCVESQILLDFNVGYRLPNLPGATLQLYVQNVLDEKHQSFPGTPHIGRLALLRLRYEFGRARQ
jgi:outer membrane receptor for ferrienterochelin and colicins